MSYSHFVDEEDVSREINFLNNSNSNIQYSLQNAKDFADFAEFAATDMAIVQILTMAQHDNACIDLDNTPGDATLPVVAHNQPSSSMESSKASWYSMFELLLEYEERYGHCNVPARSNIIEKETGEVKHLGQWLADQRKMFLKSKLLPERRDMFQRLIAKGALDWGLNYKKEKSAASWDIYFEGLLRYGDLHKHSNVPRKYTFDIDHNGVRRTLKLGDWLHKQRTRHKSGVLEDSRLQRLQSLVDRGLLYWNVSLKSSVMSSSCSVVDGINLNKESHVHMGAFEVIQDEHAISDYESVSRQARR